MERASLAKKIVEVSHLKGQFLLRSGKTSSEYFDKYRFESQPVLLREIAKQMAPMISRDIEVLAGLEMGGIPVATALSLETGIPAVFVRKEAKAYGTCQLAEGASIQGKNVLIIEDVITTGGQVLISAKDLEKLGANIREVLCVIYRGEGSLSDFSKHNLKVQALFTKQELVG